MDLQEEDRAGDGAQEAWEEEGAVLTEHRDRREGDRGEEKLASGCKAPTCGWSGRFPPPHTSLTPAPGLG